MNGSEIRKALAALPETPLTPEISSKEVGENQTTFSFDLQSFPKHADSVMLEGSEDGINFVTQEQRLEPGVFTLAMSNPSNLIVRFRAYNPNGSQAGDTLVVNS